MVSLVSLQYLVVLIVVSWLGNRSAEAAQTFNVLKYGAWGDEKTDSTEGFLKAWASACAASTGTSTVFVPKGRYLIRSVEFRGPCRSGIKVVMDGTLVAPTDYRALGNSGYWILFIQVNRLSILGGALDAKAASFWACRTSGKSCPVGARSLTLNWVKKGEIRGLTSVNSQVTHLVINSCENVKVSYVRLLAPDQSPNTDGIHVQSSTGVTITNSIMKTGDDCVSVGPGTANLRMDRIVCGPGHGVSIGSLGRSYREDGVQNVMLRNSLFTGSDNGLRIKTWARPSTGFVKDVSFRNIVMRNVENPIIIDQNYCPANQDCPTQGSGIKVDRVTYQNILGTSATEVAMAFDCSPTNPCTGIKLKDIKITYLNRNKARSLCKNIGGTSTGVIMPDNCL